MLVVFLGNLGTFSCLTNNRVSKEGTNTIKLKNRSGPFLPFSWVTSSPCSQDAAGSRVGVCHDASGASVSLGSIYKLWGVSCHSLRNFRLPELLQETGNFDRRVNLAKVFWQRLEQTVA